MNSTYARLVLAFFFALMLHLATFITWPSDSYEVSADKIFPISYEPMLLSEKPLVEVMTDRVFTQPNSKSALPSRLFISKTRSKKLDGESSTSQQSKIFNKDVDVGSETRLYYDLLDLDQAAEPEDPFSIDFSGVEITNDTQMIIEIFISETGHVDKVVFPESINPAIEKRIERDIKQTQFIPAIRQNIKVPSHKFIEFAFGP